MPFRHHDLIILILQRIFIDFLDFVRLAILRADPIMDVPNTCHTAVVSSAPELT